MAEGRPTNTFYARALYEIGSAMSLFQVKNYADEFSAIVEGKPLAEPVAEDATVGLVAEEIEQTTSDFILKQLLRNSKAIRWRNSSLICSKRWDIAPAYRPKGQTAASTLSLIEMNSDLSHRSSRFK